jgi:hypothetical protein
MLQEKKTVLSGYERMILVETLKNAQLEYEQLSEECPWFVSETPDRILNCLEMLGETAIER